jgi:hypothetical protein
LDVSVGGRGAAKEEFCVGQRRALDRFLRGSQFGFDVGDTLQRGRIGWALPPVKTIEQGAATSVLLAASPELEGVTGRYYEECAEAPVIHQREGHTGGVAPTHLTPTTPSASGKPPSN